MINSKILNFLIFLKYFQLKMIFDFEMFVTLSVLSGYLTSYTDTDYQLKKFYDSLPDAPIVLSLRDTLNKIVVCFAFCSVN